MIARYNLARVITGFPARVLIEAYELDDAPARLAASPPSNYRLIVAGDPGGGGAVLHSLSPYSEAATPALDGASGYFVGFHPDLYCVYETNSEVRAESVLFFDYPATTAVPLDGHAGALRGLFELIRREVESSPFADAMPRHPKTPWTREALSALLHAFLVYAVRVKEDGLRRVGHGPDRRLSTTLEAFLRDIETHYRYDHRPGAYAERLHVTVQTLNRLCTTRFGRTATAMIHERLVIHAKRALYLTSMPVKAVAHRLGFADEFYFSRFFKRRTGVTPSAYRERVGVDKGAQLY